MTRLELVSSGVVDMYDNLPISLNYSIADIREPDKRKASFSKTVKIPATNNNNDLLKHIYEIDGYSNFNPKVKADCVLYQDDLIILTGFMRLVNIIVDGDKIDYEINLIGDNGGFFQAIEGELLEDLDLSDLDHTLELSNVITFLNEENGVGFIYPVIENGYQDGKNWDITTMQPAIYVKEYIDRMFASAGYSYTSTFFDSSRFKRLVIPYSGAGLKYGELGMAERKVELSNAGDYTATFGESFLPFDTVDSDAGGITITSLGAIRAVKSSSYNVSFSGTWLTINAEPIFLRVVLYRNDGTYTDAYRTNNIGGSFAGETGFISFTTPEIDILPEEALAIVINNEDSSGALFPSMSDYSAKFLASNKGISAGDTVTVNDTIPKDIKQSDFFMSLVKMFNLYISQDKNSSNNLIIETREDYYGTDVVDWTDKIDNGSDLLIRPLGDLTARRYIYTYKEDKDYYNTDYKNTHDEVYGTKIFNTGNEFLQNDNTTSIIFSPTVMVGPRDVVSGGIENQFVYASISSSSFKEVSGQGITANIRILYFGGLEYVAGLYNIIVDGDVFEQVLSPKVGTVDDISNPTFDLNFGVPKDVYYTTDVYTNGNLFNIYYKGFIEELTNKDSKTVKIKMNLTASDISNLDFSKTYQVREHRLRLNKIDDYDPTGSSLATVEFILIKDAPAFTSITATTNGGINTQF